MMNIVIILDYDARRKL